MRILFTLCCLTLFACAGRAQFTNVGKEFYAVFSKQTNGESDTLSLRLYLYAARTATVHIEIPAIGSSRVVNVTPGITEVNLPPAAELRTFSTPMPGMVVQITATDDITVLGSNTMQYSSDAFLLYPATALGKEYTVFSWENSAFTANFSGARSLFTIAATMDSTTVTITPTARLSDETPPNRPISFSMNKGDALLIGTDPLDTGANLTGSIVKADKPIAVFGGHERAEIPTGFIQPGTNSTSRDHLYEQLLPNEAFGDTVVVVPYDEQSITTPQAIRIIAAEANTTIRLNDSIDLHFPSPGNYYFNDLMTGPHLVTGTKPIMGAQYMRTSPTGQGIGDPSFALVIPTSLYGKHCSFLSIPDPIYTTHAATIIVNSLQGQIRVDGYILSPPVFKAIPNSQLSYVSFVLPAGLHTVSADVPVSVTAYGAGEVISYAYMAGFGEVPQMDVSPSLSSAAAKFRGSFDLNGKLTIHSRETTRFRATLYDVLGRELFRTEEPVQLPGEDTHRTDYSRQVHPSYLLIQEYDEFDRTMGPPVFLPIP